MEGEEGGGGRGGGGGGEECVGGGEGKGGHCRRRGNAAPLPSSALQGQTSLCAHASPCHPLLQWHVRRSALQVPIVPHPPGQPVGIAGGRGLVVTDEATCEENHSPMPRRQSVRASLSGRVRE